jgi:hypothetical protein
MKKIKKGDLIKAKIGTKLFTGRVESIHDTHLLVNANGISKKVLPRQVIDNLGKK